MTEKKANVTNTQKLKTVILSVFLAVIVWFMVIYVNEPRYYDYRFGFECKICR